MGPTQVGGQPCFALLLRSVERPKSPKADFLGAKSAQHNKPPPDPLFSSCRLLWKPALAPTPRHAQRSQCP